MRLLGGTLCAAGIAALLVGARSGAGAAAGWVRADLRPVTQPALLGGAIVLYTSQKGGLRVLALDPHDGRTLWSRPATASSVAPGEAPQILFLGGHVVFFAPLAGG